MSREVQGEAPADAVPGQRGLPQRVEAGMARLVPRQVFPRKRSRTVMLAGVVSVVGCLTGWTAAGAWAPANPTNPPEAVTATVRDMRLDPDSRPEPARARLVIDVANASPGAVVVVGHATSFDAASVTGLEPRALRIAPGASRPVEVEVAVACSGPAPLRSPALRIRRADGGVRPVPVNGASQALLAVCAAGTGQQLPLVIDKAWLEGRRLAVEMSVPSGRTTQVRAVRAGGVALSASQATIAGEGTTIWLDPPVDCPQPWRSEGVPQQITLDVDVGGPASLSLPVGPALADWILADSCPADSP
jgi:hypothetical protein